jgi:hypothetical protein
VARHCNFEAVRGFDARLGAFMHQIEALEMDHLITLQRLVIVSGRPEQPDQWCRYYPIAMPAWH